MTLELNFNDSSVLRGYLHQALPQVELADDARRFLIGETGGLAYSLFSDASRLGHEMRFHSTDGISRVATYLGMLRGHLDFGRDFVEKHGFKLVSAFKNVGGRDTEIQAFDPAKSNVYTAAIGDTSIESAERLEAFLTMVKEGKPRFDESFERLSEAYRTRDKVIL